MREEILISVDIEADGPIPGYYYDALDAGNVRSSGGDLKMQMLVEFGPALMKIKKALEAVKLQPKEPVITIAWEIS